MMVVSILPPPAVLLLRMTDLRRKMIATFGASTMTDVQKGLVHDVSTIIDMQIDIAKKPSGGGD